MLIKIVIMALFGFITGGVVAAGLYAFVVSVGVITRLADATRTSSYVPCYEGAVIWGGALGNFILICDIYVPLGYPALIILGLFSGMFIGCLSMALAEVIKVFPVLYKRMGLKKGLPVAILFMALGKMAGALLQFMKGWY